MYSRDFFEAWDKNESRVDIFDRRIEFGGLFDFVYIDGDHTEAGAFSDLHSARKQLNPGGYMLVDDSGTSASSGAHFATKRLLREGGMSIVAKNPNYLLQKTV